MPLFAVKWHFVGLFSTVVYNREIKADIRHYY